VGAHRAVLRAQALAHRLEGAGGALLEGQHEVAAEHDAHLVGGEAAGLGVEVEAARDDVLVVGVFVALGALLGVQDVFLDQRVELEAPADLGHHRRVMQPVDVEPHLLAGRHGGRGTLRGIQKGFGDAAGVELDQRDAGLVGLDLADMHQ
jgi:hypothetical protein